MKRVRIDVEEIEALQKRRREINGIGIDSIDFYSGGKKVVIPKSALDEWKDIGLNNIDFAEMELSMFIEKEPTNDKD